MSGRWKRWLEWFIRRGEPVDGDLWTRRGPLARKKKPPAGRLEPTPGGAHRPARAADVPPFAA